MSKPSIGRLFLGIFLLLCLPFVSGCQQQSTKEADPIDTRQIRNIADLSTLEVYYHNVATFEEKSGLQWFFNHGYKRMWFEYTGIIEMGVDVSRVDISGPDESGLYTITLPEAEVLTNPQIDENSISDPLVETGFLTDLTDEEYLATLEEAQANMRDAANNDDSLKFQARERAKVLLERFVINYGEAVGEDYSVQFVDAPEE